MWLFEIRWIKHEDTMQGVREVEMKEFIVAPDIQTVYANTYPRANVMEGQECASIARLVPITAILKKEEEVNE